VSIIDDTETFDGYVNSEALVPGSKLLSGQYEILRYLSSGGFGITYLAKDSLNRTVVIKECFPEAFCSRVNRTVRARTQNYVDDFRSTVKLFIREAHALSRLDHPSVVGVHQVFEDNETAYMALDLIDGKDLLEIIEDGDPVMTPDEVRSLTLNLLDAIGHVHSQDLLHRDISPDNILVAKNGHPVLIDFGAAREEASRKSRVLSSVLVVKDGYSPQEFYVAGSQQSPSSDLYALAATLAHLITGEAPANSQARLAALAGNQPDPQVPLVGRFPEYDDAFLEAIDKALNIVPSERIQSADEWTLMIDHTKRIEMARAQADQDKTIDQTVMKLVKSSSVRAGETDVAKASPSQAAPTPPVARPPVEVIPPLEDLIEAPAQATVDLDEAIDALFDAEDDTDADQILLVAAEDDARKETPYVRVTSRAIAAAKAAAEEKQPLIVPSQRMSRFATVPVVFCAYLFYGHTMLQYETVQAATVKPLMAFGEGLNSWQEPSPSPVVVRRGLGS
jgi:serine/threonine protein kinase